jgi:hypothetical protein
MLHNNAMLRSKNFVMVRIHPYSNENKKKCGMNFVACYYISIMVA